MIHLSQRNHETIINALRVAADCYSGDADLFREWARDGGNSFMSPSQAERMADQFESQRDETLILLGDLDGEVGGYVFG